MNPAASSAAQQQHRRTAGQDASLDDLLHRQRLARPLALALEWRTPDAQVQATDAAWQRLDYQTLAQRVDATARYLANTVHAGDRVAWLGLNHPAQLVLLFALARLGALLVPLNHRLAPAEWAAVLDDCSPVALVHDPGFAPAAATLAAQGPGTLACHTVAACCPVHGCAKPLQPSPDNAHETPVLLVYTSGTTGTPKGAVHTQGNLLANMAMAAQVQGMTPDDVVATVLPLFHVGGLCIQTLPALWVGARVLLFSRFDAPAVLDCFATDHPTLSLQVPATLKALTEHPRWPDTPLHSLRAIWAGSSLLPPVLVDAVHARGVPLCIVYGSTETGPFSIALPPTHARSHAGSCGWPAPGVEVLLRDSTGAVVSDGAIGEIGLRAANVVQRYWPDQSARDADGFFRTGDLALRAEDGSYTVVGRAKDMIISGGENIYPAEIENLLCQHPLVGECAVVGQSDPRWGEVVVAVVVLRGQAPTSADWFQPLLDQLDGRLARYKWPRRWQHLPALPKTALGKVQKPALQALLTPPER